MKNYIKKLILENYTQFQIVRMTMKKYKRKRRNPIIDLYFKIKTELKTGKKIIYECYICNKEIQPGKELAIGKGMYRHKGGQCEQEVYNQGMKKIK